MKKALTNGMEKVSFPKSHPTIDEKWIICLRRGLSDRL
jgi:hypothetical protein